MTALAAVSVLFSIPSPQSGVVKLGPLTIHMYGLMLLLGIAACVALTGVRWRRLGGDWDLVFRVAVWGVAFGVVGARAYHDLTSWDQDPSIHAHWWGFAAVWQGGLGVWGGILVGVLAGAVVVRRAGASVLLFMDAVAPGLLLAQAIGRWGNYWNQELYGKPTKLPWGLEIDAAHRADGYLQYRTFHPTFLYEFIYDLAMVGVVLLVGRRFRIKPPGLFALYVALYTFGRTFEELLRIDPSHHFLGERVNFWVSIVVFCVSASFFVWWQFLRREGEAPRPSAPPRKAPPAGPKMAVPKGRVRSPR
jgi:prolipoprotein diacylglyceryl transferase